MTKAQKPIFGPRDDWWHACLNFAVDEFDLYAEGYRRAANLLIDHIEEHHNSEDVLLHPVLCSSTATTSNSS